MKAALFALLCTSFLSINSFASNEVKYQCIADRLQAYNSDIYYNLSTTDIETMLTIPEMFGHLDAIRFEKYCEVETPKTTTISEKQYQCIADSLQAINSDIYYNLSSTDIDSMLTIPEMMGHLDATNAAKRCGVKR